MNGVNEQVSADIVWRTQVRIAQQREGYLTRADVEAASRNLGETAETVEILIDGRVDGVAVDAFLPLACHLLKVKTIDVVAHGRGVPKVREAITAAMDLERHWAAEDEARRSRAAKPCG